MGPSSESPLEAFSLLAPSLPSKPVQIVQSHWSHLSGLLAWVQSLWATVCQHKFYVY